MILPGSILIFYAANREAENFVVAVFYPFKNADPGVRNEAGDAQVPGAAGIDLGCGPEMADLALIFETRGTKTAEQAYKSRISKCQNQQSEYSDWRFHFRFYFISFCFQFFNGFNYSLNQGLSTFFKKSPSIIIIFTPFSEMERCELNSSETT
jgi:hypothetical protein